MDWLLNMTRTEVGKKRSSLLLQILLGCLFIYSAYGKISDPSSFYYAIRQYHLASENLASYLAVILPWIEMVCGILLLSGVFVTYAVYLMVACICLFSSAQISVLLHGYVADCGCFAFLGSTAKITWLTVLRNLILLALCLRVFWQSNCVRHSPDAKHIPGRTVFILTSTVFVCAGIAVFGAASLQSDQVPRYAKEYSAALVEKARLQHKPVMVVFTSATCDYCPCAWDGPLSNQSLVQRLKGIECLVVNNKKLHDPVTEAQIKSFCISIYPSFLFIDASGQITRELVGYHEAREIIKSIDSTAVSQRSARGNKFELSASDTQ